MRFDPYLNFDGDCAEAFRHYADLLGGELDISTYGETPGSEEIPADQRDRVMHARLVVGDAVLMASDAPPGRYVPPGGNYVSVSLDAVDEARRIFDGLAPGADVQMPFEATFWSPGFGMLVDRWGTPWMVNCNAQPEGAGATTAAARES
jgi:PhnB protein